MKQVVCISQYGFDGFRFQGVCLGEPRLRTLAAVLLADGRALPRDYVDCQPDDPRYASSANYKQLCTYGVVRCGPRILGYCRQPSHDRPELALLKSIGIGGHVEPSDIGSANSIDEVIEALYEAVGRELAEEVPGAEGATIRLLGLINLDAESPHHLGILYVADLEGHHDQDEAAGFSGELVDPKFIEPANVHLMALEPWSEAVLGCLYRGYI